MPGTKRRLFPSGRFHRRWWVWGNLGWVDSIWKAMYLRNYANVFSSSLTDSCRVKVLKNTITDDSKYLQNLWKKLVKMIFFPGRWARSPTQHQLSSAHALIIEEYQCITNCLFSISVAPKSLCFHAVGCRMKGRKQTFITPIVSIKLAR